MPQLLRLILLLFAALQLLQSCTSSKTEISAEEVISKAFLAAGCNNFEGASVEFDFRSRHYKSYRSGGNYELHRITIDTNGIETKDVLTNDGFKRYINNSLIEVPDSMAAKYSASVNSVHYFAYLPLGLKDPAVKSKYLGQISIKNRNYHKLEITFIEEEGGKDFEDVFLYWIDMETFTVDYLAYQFHINNGGIRFREAYNPRIVEGIRFVDYLNYKASNTVDFSSIDSLYSQGKLELLSDIKLENIVVKR